jgi:hypothetical protein
MRTVLLLEPGSLNRCNHEATDWVVVESEFDSLYWRDIFIFPIPPRLTRTLQASCLVVTRGSVPWDKAARRDVDLSSLHLVSRLGIGGAVPWLSPKIHFSN